MRCYFVTGYVLLARIGYDGFAYPELCNPLVSVYGTRAHGKKLSENDSYSTKSSFRSQIERSLPFYFILIEG